MPEWSDDLSGWSLEELQRTRAEYRIQARGLRLKSAAFINSRLAKQISMEDYLEGRKSGADEAAECKRRAIALDNEIAFRRSYAAQR